MNDRITLSYRTIDFWLGKVAEWHDPDEHLAPPQQEELSTALREARLIIAEVAKAAQSKGGREDWNR